MAKKVKIKLTNKPNLSELFHTYLDKKKVTKGFRSNRQLSFFDDCDFTKEELMEMGFFTGDEWEDETDDADVVFPYNYQKKGKNKKEEREDDYDFNDFALLNGKKKKKHKKNKNKNKIDINAPYSGFEGEGSESEQDNDDKVTIYFYPNYNDKKNHLTFNSLVAFDKFCLDNGYTVSQEVSEDIVYTPLSHTCLDPVLRQCGIYSVVQGYTYASMHYQCTVNSSNLY